MKDKEFLVQLSSIDIKKYYKLIHQEEIMFKKSMASNNRSFAVCIFVYIFSFLFLFFTENAKAQTLNWSTNWGIPNNYLFAFSVGTDYENNVYLSGGSVNPGGRISSTLKYNEFGALQWEKTYNANNDSRFNSLSVSYLDGSSYIISVTGYDGSSPYFGCRTIAYDQEGNERFDKLYYGPGYIYGFVTSGSQVITDSYGNTYVCGASPRAINQFFPTYYYFLVAYDRYGNQLFIRTWDGGYDDHARGLTLSGGNIYVTGYSQNSSSNWDVVTLAYTLVGDFLWESQRFAVSNPDLDQNAFDVASDIIRADYTTGVYTCAKGLNGNFATIKYNTTNGSIVWSHAEYQGTPESMCLFPKPLGRTYAHTNDVIVTGSSGNGDCQTILYNDNGTQVWRSTNNGGSLENLALDVCTDASENVYITGQINNTLSNVDLLAVKYNNRGNKIWAASYDYEGSYDAGFGIAKDLNGNINIVGTCGLASQTESDFWIMQIQSGSLDKPNNISENTANSYNFLLGQNFPNPFNPNTVIQYSVPKDGYVYLKIFDILGREVSTLVNGVRTSGNYSVKFNGENLPSGVYFYKLNAGSFTDVKKMILIK